MIAALYVDRLGPYAKIADVDAWDEARDARTYPGPGPIVAHPPCGPWGKLRHLYQGTEHALAPWAVAQVRRFGGVLEHPAESRLWSACDLPPIGLPWRDEFGGYSVAIDQVEFGHVARKQTWLYLVGVPRTALEASPYPNRQPTHYASGGRTPSSRNGGAVPAGMKVCSAQQRRRTPPELAAYLVRLARAALEARKAA